MGHIRCKFAHSGLHRISTSPSHSCLLLLHYSSQMLWLATRNCHEMQCHMEMQMQRRRQCLSSLQATSGCGKGVPRSQCVCVRVCVRPSQGKFWSLMKLHNCRDWRSISASSASSRVELSYEIASTYYTIFINIFLPRLLLLP